MDAAFLEELLAEAGRALSDSITAWSSGGPAGHSLIAGPPQSGKSFVLSALATIAERSGVRVLRLHSTAAVAQFGGDLSAYVVRVISAAAAEEAVQGGARRLPPSTLLLWEGLDTLLGAVGSLAVHEGARALCRALLRVAEAAPPCVSSRVLCIATVEDVRLLHPLAAACFYRCVRLGTAAPLQVACAMSAVLSAGGLFAGHDPAHAEEAAAVVQRQSPHGLVKLLNVPTAASLLQLAASVACASYRLGDALQVAGQAVAAIETIVAALEGVPRAAGATADAAATTAAAAAAIILPRVCNVDVGRLLARLAAGHAPVAVMCAGGDGGDAEPFGEAAPSGGAAAVTLEPWAERESSVPSSSAVPASAAGKSAGAAPAGRNSLLSSAVDLADFADYYERPRRRFLSAAAGVASTGAPFDASSTPGSVTAAHLSTTFAGAAGFLGRMGRHDDGRTAGPASRGAQPAGAVSGTPLRSRSHPWRRRPIPASLSLLLRPSLPAVAWREVAGAENAKRALHDALLWPLRHADAAAALGVTLPTGVLLYGPPGTGKTLLAKALATALGARFLAVPIPQVLRAGVGESERALVAAFTAAAAAAPCVLFLDELQALFGRRGAAHSGGDEADRMSSLLTSQFLLCLDAVAARAQRNSAANSNSTASSSSSSSSVFVLGATNVPGALDAALLRPGRFDRAVYVGLPGAPDRRALFDALLQRAGAAGAVAPGSAREAILHPPPPGAAEALARESEGFSGADIAGVGRLAAAFAVREALATAAAGGAPATEMARRPKVGAHHLFAAVASMRQQRPLAHASA